MDLSLSLSLHFFTSSPCCSSSSLHPSAFRPTAHFCLFLLHLKNKTSHSCFFFHHCVLCLRSPALRQTSPLRRKKFNILKTTHTSTHAQNSMGGDEWAVYNRRTFAPWYKSCGHAERRSARGHSCIWQAVLARCFEKENPQIPPPSPSHQVGKTSKHSPATPPRPPLLPATFAH